jgi:UDP-glucuronate 4-epimerase
MKILVTGAAGFIGFHTASALLAAGHTVTGIDNYNAYYDVGLKHARIAAIGDNPQFTTITLDLADRAATSAVFETGRFDRVVHLAAQAGVRYSIDNPHAYVDANLQGFINVLEGCRRTSVAHCVFASSSSVYGANTTMPFRVEDNVDHPLSLYAATKKANELMAHSYAHLYRLPLTGLRFFTVYGPWGRPDMAIYSFTDKILKGEPIPVYNQGRHSRDFTYIDDIVTGVVRTLDQIAQPDPAWSGAAPNPASSSAPYRLYNIGNANPTELMVLIETLERALGRTAIKQFLPMQLGDVLATAADTSALEVAVGFKPATPLSVGINRFVTWYRQYYGV